MAARATAVHRKNQPGEELEGKVKRPKLSMPDLPSGRGTVIRQPAKNRSTRYVGGWRSNWEAAVFVVSGRQPLPRGTRKGTLTQSRSSEQ